MLFYHCLLVATSQVCLDKWIPPIPDMGYLNSFLLNTRAPDQSHGNVFETSQLSSHRSISSDLTVSTVSPSSASVGSIHEPLQTEMPRYLHPADLVYSPGDGPHKLSIMISFPEHFETHA